MTETYFAIGSAANTMSNIERAYGLVPNVLPSARIPLTGVQVRRSLSGKGRADGWINGTLLVDFCTQAELDAFMLAALGGYTTPSAYRYFTLIDEQGKYSPFAGYIDKPTFSVASGGNPRGLSFPLTNLVLQSVTKTSNYTVTTSDHLVYGDTTSGSVTLTLPQVSTVNIGVAFSFVKTASANSLILDPYSSEQIQNGSTYTLTAQYERVDIVRDGSSWTII